MPTEFPNLIFSFQISGGATRTAGKVYVKHARRKAAPQGIPVKAIDMADYGMQRVTRCWITLCRSLQRHIRKVYYEFVISINGCRY